jgi:predicted metal-dependent enzyme (double-stranded beta helix superfamily)
MAFAWQAFNGESIPNTDEGDVMTQLHEMNETLGERFVEYISGIKESWKAADSQKISISTRNAMERLLRSCPEDEPWIRKLMVEKQRQVELYRDEEYGFLQMGHWHPMGHTSPPHDHGQHWVVYGVYSGEIEISTYRLHDQGSLEVVDTHRLAPGVAYCYLPGQIHSTREIHPEGSAILRFLSTDLTKVKRAHYSWDRIRKG